MQERLKSTLTLVTDKWKSLDKRQKIRLILTFVVFITTLTITIYFVAKPKMYTLLKNQDPQLIAEAQQVLNDANIFNKPIDTGTSLQVKESEVGKVKLALNSSPMAATGRLAYEDALNLSGMGTTETVKKQTMLRVLQGDLEGLLCSFDGVQSAQVFITVPEENTFYIQNVEKAKATARIELRGDQTIDKKQALAMATSIANAVRGLELENVLIVDQSANAIFSGVEQEPDSYVTTYEMEQVHKKEIDGKIVATLGRLYNDVKVISNIKLNMSKTTQTEEKYAPYAEDAEVGLPSKSVQDKLSVTGNANLGEPGVGTNQQTTPNYQIGADGNSNGTSTSKITDYLYDKTLRTTEESMGDVIPEQSSISIVAYKYRTYDEEQLTKDNTLNNDMTWQKFKIQQENEVKLTVDPELVEALIAGTKIENLKLVAYEIPFFIDKVPVKRNIEQIVMFFILALLILLLAYGLIRRTQIDVVTEIEPELSVEDLLVSTQLEEEKEAVEEAIGLKNIDFSKESEVKRQIEKFVNEKPESVAQLLRNWLNEDWGD